MTYTPPMPPWLDLAEKELGVHETPGPKATARIITYHSMTVLKATSDEIPWCSGFANFCVIKSGFKGTLSALARSWLKTGVRLSYPAFGCITVLSRPPDPNSGHVGFYIGSSSSDTVRILGGNQSDSVSIQNFPKSRVLAYIWPDMVQGT